MKINKILLTASLLFGGLCANAQETVTEYVFTPHWYVQGQFGLQETLGEGAFGKLLSPNAQLAVGYKFNPYIGARLAVNAWQSKAILKLRNEADPRWKWNYVAPTIDAVVDMTNLIGGFDPNRLVEVNLIAGIGMNIGFNNKEANKINNTFKKAAASSNIATTTGTLPLYVPDYDILGNIWSGSKLRFLGQFGLDVNFNVTDRLQLGLELMANSLSDNYNSKVGSNTDWYFNGLVGVKYAFGPKYETRTRVIPAPEPQIIEKVVEKIVEVAAPQVEQQAVKKEVEVLRRDVFFKINTTAITPNEMTKVATIADFLQEHPDATVTVTGYADKGTGSLQLNLRLAAKRAEAVADALKTKYGISASRITVKSMGNAEDQPYPDPVQNRVAICIAQ